MSNVIINKWNIVLCRENVKLLMTMRVSWGLFNVHFDSNLAYLAKTINDLLHLGLAFNNLNQHFGHLRRFCKITREKTRLSEKFHVGRDRTIFEETFVPN